MTTKLTKTPELNQALSRDETVVFVDDAGQPTHVVVPMDEARAVEDYVRREVQRGLEQSERGEVAPWNVHATLAEAHRRHAEQMQNETK